MCTSNLRSCVPAAARHPQQAQQAQHAVPAVLPMISSGSQMEVTEAEARYTQMRAR